jgi:hypothetical protein
MDYAMLYVRSITTMTKDQALHIARVALTFRRQQVIEYWILAHDLKDANDMELWASVIRDINDAHSILL